MSSLRSCSVSVNIVSQRLSAVSRSNAMFSTYGNNSCTIHWASTVSTISLKIYVRLAFTKNSKRSPLIYNNINGWLISFVFLLLRVIVLISNNSKTALSNSNLFTLLTQMSLKTKRDSSK